MANAYSGNRHGDGENYHERRSFGNDSYSPNQRNQNNSNRRDGREGGGGYGRNSVYHDQDQRPYRGGRNDVNTSCNANHVGSQNFSGVNSASEGAVQHCNMNHAGMGSGRGGGGGGVNERRDRHNYNDCKGSYGQQNAKKPTWREIKQFKKDRILRQEERKRVKELKKKNQSSSGNKQSGAMDSNNDKKRFVKFRDPNQQQQEPYNRQEWDNRDDRVQYNLRESNRQNHTVFFDTEGNAMNDNIVTDAKVQPNESTSTEVTREKTKDQPSNFEVTTNESIKSNATAQMPKTEPMPPKPEPTKPMTLIKPENIKKEKTKNAVPAVTLKKEKAKSSSSRSSSSNEDESSVEKPPKKTSVNTNTAKPSNPPTEKQAMAATAKQTKASSSSSSSDSSSDDSSDESPTKTKQNVQTTVEAKEKQTPAKRNSLNTTKTSSEEEVVCLGNLEKKYDIEDDDDSDEKDDNADDNANEYGDESEEEQETVNNILEKSGKSIAKVKAVEQCMICDEKGHTSFQCQMICKNCAAPHHNFKSCPKPANISIMLQSFMEFCMLQLSNFNPEQRYSLPAHIFAAHANAARAESVAHASITSSATNTKRKKETRPQRQLKSKTKKPVKKAVKVEQTTESEASDSDAETDDVSSDDSSTDSQPVTSRTKRKRTKSISAAGVIAKKLKLKSTLHQPLPYTMPAQFMAAAANPHFNPLLLGQMLQGSFPTGALNFNG